MWAYLCIASNGVPPSVSKTHNADCALSTNDNGTKSAYGAVESKGVTLECQSEAFPKSINYWTRERGDIVPPGGKYTSNVTEIGEYRSSMKLHINLLTQAEFGAYRCVAKNSLGDTDGTIKLYRIPPNAVNYVENAEGRYKGNNKKRVKSSELYHQSKMTDGGSEEAENPGKRKDMILGNELEDGYYDSAAVAEHCQHHKLTVTATLLFTTSLLLRKVAPLIDV
ncbi:unnamed protein product [Ceratitis capitata]|uniref:(Mediterranean fruit fly) hypothetical protein n=1 Tax=Ceratitis capitata TaxID=7213 RepID=A0A811UN14_CERCA|nr:unnamed protein product [Ceratitis capitata]